MIRPRKTLPHNILFFALSRLALSYTLILLTVLSLMAMSGCSYDSHSSTTRRHLILGFGVVEVDSSMDQHEVADGLHARAQRIEAKGAFLSLIPGFKGIFLGSSKRQSVEINPKAELIIDANARKDGILKVKTSSPVKSKKQRHDHEKRGN